MTPVYHIHLLQTLSMGSATTQRETVLEQRTRHTGAEAGAGRCSRHRPRLHRCTPRRQGPAGVPERSPSIWWLPTVHQAIGLWSDTVFGWKVGYIAAERRDGSGDERLLGPIFKRQLWNDTGGTTDIPVFVGASPQSKQSTCWSCWRTRRPDSWTGPRNRPKRCLRASIGVEVASSPLATINELGPRVVVSDFGNNNGLVLGPEIVDWTARDENSLRAETLIEGEVVGTGGATRLPGGLRAAYAFALSRSALRGRPLRKGDLIATGNATGIHDIEAGQTALVRFAGFGDIACRAVPAG